MPGLGWLQLWTTWSGAASQKSASLPPPSPLHPHSSSFLYPFKSDSSSRGGPLPLCYICLKSQMGVPDRGAVGMRSTIICSKDELSCRPYHWQHLAHDPGRIWGCSSVLKYIHESTLFVYLLQNILHPFGWLVLVLVDVAYHSCQDSLFSPLDWAPNQ